MDAYRSKNHPLLRKHRKGGSVERTKSVITHRPPWDDSVNNLSALALSVDELIRRKLQTTSHNNIAAPSELKRKLGKDVFVYEGVDGKIAVGVTEDPSKTPNRTAGRSPSSLSSNYQSSSSFVTPPATDPGMLSLSNRQLSSSMSAMSSPSAARRYHHHTAPGSVENPSGGTSIALQQQQQPINSAASLSSSSVVSSSSMMMNTIPHSHTTKGSTTPAWAMQRRFEEQLAQLRAKLSAAKIRSGGEKEEEEADVVERATEESLQRNASASVEKKKNKKPIIHAGVPPPTPSSPPPPPTASISSMNVASNRYQAYHTQQHQSNPTSITADSYIGSTLHQRPSLRYYQSTSSPTASSYTPSHLLLNSSSVTSTSGAAKVTSARRVHSRVTRLIQVPDALKDIVRALASNGFDPEGDDALAAMATSRAVDDGDERQFHSDADKNNRQQQQQLLGARPPRRQQQQQQHAAPFMSPPPRKSSASSSRLLLSSSSNEYSSHHHLQYQGRGDEESSRSPVAALSFSSPSAAVSASSYHLHASGSVSGRSSSPSSLSFSVRDGEVSQMMQDTSNHHSHKNLLPPVTEMEADDDDVATGTSNQKQNNDNTGKKQQGLEEEEDKDELSMAFLKREMKERVRDEARRRLGLEPLYHHQQQQQQLPASSDASSDYSPSRYDSSSASTAITSEQNNDHHHRDDDGDDDAASTKSTDTDLLLQGPDAFLAHKRKKEQSVLRSSTSSLRVADLLDTQRLLHVSPSSFSASPSLLASRHPQPRGGTGNGEGKEVQEEDTIAQVLSKYEARLAALTSSSSSSSSSSSTSSPPAPSSEAHISSATTNPAPSRATAPVPHESVVRVSKAGSGVVGSSSEDTYVPTKLNFEYCHDNENTTPSHTTTSRRANSSERSRVRFLPTTQIANEASKNVVEAAEEEYSLPSASAHFSLPADHSSMLIMTSSSSPRKLASSSSREQQKRSEDAEEHQQQELVPGGGFRISFDSTTNSESQMLESDPMMRKWTELPLPSISSSSSSSSSINMNGPWLHSLVDTNNNHHHHQQKQQQQQNPTLQDENVDENAIRDYSFSFRHMRSGGGTRKGERGLKSGAGAEAISRAPFNAPAGGNKQRTNNVYPAAQDIEEEEEEEQTTIYAYVPRGQQGPAKVLEAHDYQQQQQQRWLGGQVSSSPAPSSPWLSGVLRTPASRAQTAAITSAEAAEPAPRPSALKWFGKASLPFSKRIEAARNGGNCKTVVAPATPTTTPASTAPTPLPQAVASSLAHVLTSPISSASLRSSSSSPPAPSSPPGTQQYGFHHHRHQQGQSMPQAPLSAIQPPIWRAQARNALMFSSSEEAEGIATRTPNHQKRYDANSSSSTLAGLNPGFSLRFDEDNWVHHADNTSKIRDSKNVVYRGGGENEAEEEEQEVVVSYQPWSTEIDRTKKRFDATDEALFLMNRGTSNNNYNNRYTTTSNSMRHYERGNYMSSSSSSSSSPALPPAANAILAASVRAKMLRMNNNSAATSGGDDVVRNLADFLSMEAQQQADNNNNYFDNDNDGHHRNNIDKRGILFSPPPVPMMMMQQSSSSRGFALDEEDEDIGGIGEPTPVPRVLQFGSNQLSMVSTLPTTTTMMTNVDVEGKENQGVVTGASVGKSTAKGNVKKSSINNSRNLFNSPLVPRTQPRV